MTKLNVPSYIRDYFLKGCKKPGEECIGVEWEKLGVYKENAEAIRYYGRRGVEAIFKALIRRYGWRPADSEGPIIALKKQRSSITLEPGGQIELSGRKAKDLDENARELLDHLREIKAVSDPLGIAWLGLGMQPVSRLSEISWVPKKRYAIMRRLLKDKGPLTFAMMKQTASIQVSLDYISEKDAIEKLRLAFALSPIFAAMFANSPVSEGRLNGYCSMRSHIWAKTDPSRTGILYDVFKRSFSFEDYVDYALSVPMFFIIRGSRWITADGLNFRQFLRTGLKGYRPQPADWELHLTTLFTETRLKKYIEIRSIDCQKTELGLAVPALIKGLFYDPKARYRAWGLVEGYTMAQRRKLRSQAPRMGLKACLGGMTVLQAARKLTEWAGEGLKPEEKGYLLPLRRMLEAGVTPAETVMGCYKSKIGRKEKAAFVIGCAAL